ncbi:hypothetical protein MKX01_028481, partial [Papaver californicum]
MEKLIIHKNTSSVDWKPSPIIVLATSIDGSKVVTIHGDPDSRVSSLVWCRSNCKTGRLLSSSIDGSSSEWDLFHVTQKILLDSIGASILQMPVEPLWHDGRVHIYPVSDSDELTYDMNFPRVS